jgi:predicted DNA-binding protein
MINKKQYQFRLPDSLKEKANTKANKEEKTLSEAVRRLLEGYVKGVFKL